MESTEPKKQWYKRWWMWPVYAIFALAFIDTLNDVENAEITVPVAVSQTQTEEAPTPEAIKVTPNALIAEYEANGVAADAKYKGKLVEVKGIVKNIDKDILDVPYISFETNNAFSGVQCMFDKGDEAKLATVKKGQSITLQGTITGQLMNVLIEDCEEVMN